ncbi:Universal stress protein family [Arthrobacter sp. PAMC 25486]|uniref:universal stress protein n=1 Tax=Arthrobacter sp. PAMC 25486 TaxID=1494608 RepID=UPI000535B24B|nr:universal stress protein [Arthrobacter sp. PAMC 25486]AIX99952.1 Universal stress protein family [Arthrobacter sp. PAMC 25486]
MEDQTTREDSHIVVGVDGSPESVLALNWAKTLAPALDATIVAVTAWHFETSLGPYAAAEWDPEADAQKILQDALAEAFGDQLPAGLSSQVDRGRPAQVLLEAGKSAQMLIVGSRGHGGFTGLLLGSVSSACTEHANCPVLVVHSGSQAPAGGDSEREVACEPADNV